MIRFYAPDIENDSVLPESESLHCCRVLRMRSGDEINVVDGKGNAYLCRIVKDHPKAAEVEIISKLPDEVAAVSTSITLAIAPTKNSDRIEWLAEKAVEIGVDKLVFLQCHNSVRKTINADRIKKVMISAMKQSLHSKLPELVALIQLKDFVNSDLSDARFVGYCDEKIERLEFVKNYDGKEDITILIGPEGDFTSEEIEMLLDKDYKPVTFGPMRLRTETAALYALCATHALISLHSR